jgi:hypothetical protein
MTNIPYVPANAQADAMSKEIIVVPNPYKVDGAHAYPSAGLMRWTNVPSKCTIRIFTVAGELVATIKHDDPTKGEATWTQVANARGGRMPAGVYYWNVESNMSGGTGQMKRGTFMLIK